MRHLIYVKVISRLQRNIFLVAKEALDASFDLCKFASEYYYINFALTQGLFGDLRTVIL
jgi:hypothetical protein